MADKDIDFTDEQQAKINEIVAREKAKATKSATEGLFSPEDVKAQVQAEIEKQRSLWDEQRKVEQMTEKEKQGYEFKQLQEKLQNLQKEKAEIEAKQVRTELTNQASKILAEKGITPDERTLKFVVKDDADSTQTAIDDFISLIADKTEANRQAGLSGRTPRNSDGSNAKTYTAQEFMKLKSFEQMKFKRDNPEAYASIFPKK